MREACTTLKDHAFLRFTSRAFHQPIDNGFLDEDHYQERIWLIGVFAIGQRAGVIVARRSTNQGGFLGMYSVKMCKNFHTRPPDRFGAFVVVGIFNTVFGYSVFAIALWVWSSHQLALTVATVAGVVFNFFSTGRLVFSNRNADRFPTFIMGYAAIYLVNILLLDLMVSLAGFPPLLAQAILLPIMVVFSFSVNRFIVFRR